MTATGTLANPDCDVCRGTGTDPVFFGDCTECWPQAAAAHREELWHARRQAAMLPTVPDEPAPYCVADHCWAHARSDGDGGHHLLCDLHWWTHQAEVWEARTEPDAAMWARHARRRAAQSQPRTPQRSAPRQPSH